MEAEVFSISLASWVALNNQQVECGGEVSLSSACILRWAEPEMFPWGEIALKWKRGEVFRKFLIGLTLIFLFFIFFHVMKEGVLWCGIQWRTCNLNYFLTVKR